MSKKTKAKAHWRKKTSVLDGRFWRTAYSNSLAIHKGLPSCFRALYIQNRRAKTASHLRTRNSCCRARKITAGTLCGCQGDLTKLCAKISGSGAMVSCANAPNAAQFTADALSVASLADFPATVTKMLANTQSIRCAFCLTCQKTGRRDSALRIVRYCPKKTCLTARRMSGRANGFLTFSSGGPHVTAKRLLRRQP